MGSQEAGAFLQTPVIRQETPRDTSHQSSAAVSLTVHSSHCESPASPLSSISTVPACAPKMTSPVTKAMIESYALMVMVMGTFFVYFCGMVWAFCNPKLSETEEECGTGDQTDGCEEHRWPSAPSSPQRDIRCACAHPPAPPPHTAETLTETTYVNFWDDNDSLLSDCAVSSRDDYGITNQIAESSSWTA